MGRSMNKVEKPSVEKTEQVEIKETTEIKAENPSSNSEMDALKKQVELLQAMLLNNMNTTNKPSSDDGYIRADRSVQVMSLTPHLLNLSTQGLGRGKPFQFFKYGDVKSIIYSDLSDILAHYHDKAEEGAFYIFDKEVVKRHGLEPAYTNILDKEAIDTFLDRDISEVKSVFTGLSEIQQDSIVDMIVRKIVADEDVSTSKVNAIKDIYGKDIFQMADDMLNWEKTVAELESEK
jgi:hypothetical protein